MTDGNIILTGECGDLLGTKGDRTVLEDVEYLLAFARGRQGVVEGTIGNKAAHFLIVSLYSITF